MSEDTPNISGLVDETHSVHGVRDNTFPRNNTGVCNELATAGTELGGPKLAKSDIFRLSVPLLDSNLDDLDLHNLPPLPDSDSDSDSDSDDSDGNTNSMATARLAFEEEQYTHRNEDNALDQIPSIYRLLDLVYESGSGGLVEKVVISQQSLGLLLNRILPGSYQSVSRIDFKALDEITIKPKGVYGNKAEIAKFLRCINCIDDEIAERLSEPSANGSNSDQSLISGLYLVLPPAQNGPEKSYDAYIMYWPEDATWDDQATSSVRRNRITFMRYLTQLSDQTIALVSAEQAAAFVWDSGTRKVDHAHGQDDEDEDDMRMFSFQVDKAEEQEESVTASPGFKIEIPRSLIRGENVALQLVHGDISAALAVSSVEKPRSLATKRNEEFTSIRLRSTLTSSPEAISLGRTLSYPELRILEENGLRTRCARPFENYDVKLKQAMSRKIQEIENAKQEVRIQLEKERTFIEASIRLIVDEITREFRSYLKNGPSSEKERDRQLLPIDSYPGILELYNNRRKKPMQHVRSERFQELKAKWCLIRDYFKSNNLSSDDQKSTVGHILQTPLEALTGQGAKERRGNVVLGAARLLYNFVIGKESSSVSELSDIVFLKESQLLLEDFPSLADFNELIKSSLQRHLEDCATEFVNLHISKISNQEEETRFNNFKGLLDNRFSVEMRGLIQELFWEIREALKLQPMSESTLVIESVSPCPARAYRHKEINFTIGFTQVRRIPRRFRYVIYPLELTECDIQQCRSDDTYVPLPHLTQQLQFQFTVEESYCVKFMRLIGRKKCICILSSEQQSHVYINDYASIDTSIKSKQPITRFYHERLGGDPTYAFDEITRSLAILHDRKNPRVTLWVFDENFQMGRCRLASLPLIAWYDETAEIEKICFVSGSQELCLVDSLGHARIFSLVSEQFRPASLHIDCPVIDVFSAPDGSCLFVTVKSHELDRQKLLAYHWASFGKNDESFSPMQLPSRTAIILTSFENRNRMHLLSLSLKDEVIASTALRVKQKSTEFAFKSTQGVSQTAASVQTLNNCLVDCHMDVWTRFPVLPAVPRNTLSNSIRRPRTIIFASGSNFEGIRQYFVRMVSTFERTTCKPTDGILFAIKTEWSSDPLDVVANSILGSYFHFGGFVVELLCLIPIHLAVTRENRFIPLKDGIFNLAHERNLLGADVPTIISTLSIGWYESLFQSYMATKPVRVISSMGEQSVGKSYCLNHFSDSSFAGSAMRTTEGIWLSCTPTNDYLLVSLDFEGVHSIERSAQEDTLLVLFNAAISNLIFFRNNFAISREIAGLFSSFQSSAMVLDPHLNPSLFNSVLAIIIKDVIASDAQDIVKEFRNKFQAIVQEEQDQNFITRLHRGKINIIPWAVINSPGFYNLFRKLRIQLDKQEITYSGGGVFLHTLKTLMAKIKANDWGALDQNLAAHRAQVLTELLPTALSRGGIDQGSDIWGALKNLDTDEELVFQTPVTDEVFWTPFAELGHEEYGSAIDASLASLVEGFEAHLVPRHQSGEKNYKAEIQNRISTRLEHRIEQVGVWIAVNTSRFPAENQHIRDLVKTWGNMILTMRDSIRICSATCSLCHLSCLHSSQRQHMHDCKTTHTCPFHCDVNKGHSEPDGCGLPAGHSGRHLCDATKHSCGQDCWLKDRNGCAYSCLKPIDHDGEHLCSARTHFCGEPCDLKNIKEQNDKVFYHCPGYCQIPWNEPHKQHACGILACPIECQLCRRLCCDTNHFHALNPTSIHLCGQEHDCMMFCEAAGICQIETQPSAILQQFSGRFETFEYTHYSQEKRRLSCIIRIPPGQLDHQGTHTHSATGNVFHFCDAQCPRCKYFCTLPLGHPQQQHETSHGSMTETQWLVEGSGEDIAYELQGRKFGSGDQGAPMLCSLLCSQQGRHTHVDYCRSAECDGPEQQHISHRVLPNPEAPKDWISHGLYWARSGFKDPYSRDEQLEFAKCDAYCAAPEHDASAVAPANPSYCMLAIFHPPRTLHPAPRTGYVSTDGHLFNCVDPAKLRKDYHIVFVIDSSTSMTLSDRVPLANTPITSTLHSSCNNRYGAVLSALFGFWSSRQVAITSSTRTRTDAYSVINFAESATTSILNDTGSSPKRLIAQLIPRPDVWGTNFTAALAHAALVIEQNWDDSRVPVLVFLSDGECRIADEPVLDICRRCVELGKPLMFYTVSFGSDRRSRSLRQMANVAHGVYASTLQHSNNPTRANPCLYANAVDSIELATTFLDIANALQKPRASLIGSSNNRYVAPTN